MLIERILSGSDSGIEIVVIEGGVDDGVAVVFQVSRFDAARYAVPAVKKEDSQGCPLPVGNRCRDVPQYAEEQVVDFGSSLGPLPVLVAPNASVSSITLDGLNVVPKGQGEG